MDDYSSPQFNNCTSLEWSGSLGLYLQFGPLGCRAGVYQTVYHLTKDHPLGSMEKFELWRSPQCSDLPVFCFLEVYHCNWELPLVTAHPLLLLGYLHLGKIWLLIQVQMDLRVLVVFSVPLVQDSINCICFFLQNHIQTSSFFTSWRNQRHSTAGTWKWRSGQAQTQAAELKSNVRAENTAPS